MESSASAPTTVPYSNRGSPGHCLLHGQSAVYDYSYNWTIDPGMYDDYSICYFKDLDDVYVISE